MERVFSFERIRALLEQVSGCRVELKDKKYPAGDAKPDQYVVFVAGGESTPQMIIYRHKGRYQIPSGFLFPEHGRALERFLQRVDRWDLASQLDECRVSLPSLSIEQRA